MTIRQALSAAAAQLSHHEELRPTASRDAELLLMHTLNIPRSTVFAYPDRLLSEEEELSYRQDVDRRATGEPIQYITGKQEFYGLDFYVSPAVLIPRPETEHLVEAVLQAVPADEPLRILDVGTGSGILPVTLALKLPHSNLTAVDISREAIAVARRNAERHNVAHRIDFVESDLLAGVTGSRFDVIVSNPPYIPATDRANLHPQVREYEPSTALFAGPDGLDIYRRLIPQTLLALKPKGLLALEIGYGQQNALAGLLAGWQDVSFIKDLQQIHRIVLARPPAKDK